MDIRFSFSSSPWIVLVMGCVILLLTYWYYRKTRPPVKDFIRIGLIVLRALTLFQISLLLLKPLISIEKSFKRPAIIALLVDQSSSMRINEEGVSRGEILKRTFQSPQWKLLQSRVHLKTYVFSDNVIPFEPFVIDSLRFLGSGTNLSAALREVCTRNQDDSLSCLILLTDGANNVGDDPIRTTEKIGIPVYSICFGQAEQKPDLILSRIQTNQVVYKDHQVPVEITCRGPGFGGNTGVLILRQDQNFIDKKTITFPSDGLEKSVRFTLTPKTDGILRFHAMIESTAGEMTLENNEKEFYMKVLKNKFQVLLLSGRPSPDLSFLKRFLDEDNNVDLEVFTGRQNKAYYEGQFPNIQQLENKDLFILLNFPHPDTPEIHWEMVRRTLIEKHIPFFLMAGKDIDRNRILSIESLLPIPLPQQVPERYLFSIPTKGNEIHPVVRMEESLTNSREMWRQLPPVLSVWNAAYSDLNLSLLTGLEDQGTGSLGDSNISILLLRHQKKEKSLLFLGHGFYRWDLLMWGIGETNTVFKRFIENSIRWLATQEQERNIRLSTDKRVYQAGEEVHFSVQLFDESFQPLDNAGVTLRVMTPSREIQFPLKGFNQGTYQSMQRFFPAGQYRAIAEASLQGHLVGRDTTEITITSFNTEFLNSRANPDLLMHLAQMTGAKSGPPDSLHSILESIQFPRQTVVSVQEIELFHWSIMLFVLILLLSFEWWVRKRKGML
jgi:hypothetical protein